MAPVAKDNGPDSSESGSECSEETVIIPRSNAAQRPVVDLNDPQNYAADRPVRTTRNMNPVYRDIPPQMEFNKATSITKTKKKGPGPGPKPKMLTPRRQTIIANFLREIVAQARQQGFVRVQWRAELMQKLQPPLGRGGTALAPVTNLDLSNWLKDKKFAEVLKTLEQGGASTSTAALRNGDSSADNQPGSSSAVGGVSSKKRKALQLNHYEDMAKSLPIQPNVVIEPLDLTKYKSKGKTDVTLRDPAPANLTNGQEEGKDQGPVIPLRGIQEDPAHAEDDQHQVEPEAASQGPSKGEQGQQQQEDRKNNNNQKVQQDEGVVVVARSSGSSPPLRFESASASPVAPGPVAVPAPLGRSDIVSNALFREPPAPVVQNEDQYIAAMVQVRQLRYHISQTVTIYNGFNDGGYPEGMNGELVQHLLNAVLAALYDPRIV